MGKEDPAPIFDGHAWTVHSAHSSTTDLTFHRIPGPLTNLPSEIRKGVMVSSLSHIEEGDLDDSGLKFAERADAPIGELKKSRAPNLAGPRERIHQILGGRPESNRESLR